MEVMKNKNLMCGVTIWCLISVTFAFPRAKRQMFPGNPWFGGEFEGGPMAGGPFSYQSARFPGNRLPGGTQQFPSMNSAGQQRMGPQMMPGLGAEIEPTQPADIEPAEGAMMGSPAMGGFNTQPTNPALQNSVVRQQFSNNNINRGMPQMPFAMAGPMGEVEAPQAPDIEPAEGIMPTNPMSINGGGFPMNSPWNNPNSFPQNSVPRQATPLPFSGYGLPFNPFNDQSLGAGNSFPQNSAPSSRASLSNVLQPQRIPTFVQNPNPTEIPILRNPPIQQPSVSLSAPSVNNSPFGVSLNPPQSNQVPPSSSILAVQPQPMQPMPIISAVNAQTASSAGPVAPIASGPGMFEPTQAPPPMSNNPSVNSGPRQVGPVIAPPSGSVQAPPFIPAGVEFEPTQAPDIEPMEAGAAANQASVLVQSLPYQPSPADAPMKVVVDQAGIPPKTPLSAPQWEGYVF